MKRSDLQAGSLLTRQERYMLRLEFRDLSAQLERARSTAQRQELERALGSIRREQQADRAARPRSKKEKRR